MEPDNDFARFLCQAATDLPMCGRFTFRTPARQFIRFFPGMVLPDLRPRYNIAPGQLVAVLHCGERFSVPVRADTFRWGLVPAADSRSDIRRPLINARSETAAEKWTFRQAFRERRCVVPADGFFEWEKSGNRRLPWYIRYPDSRPFVFAALWEPAVPNIGRTADSTAHPTCTILTTEASADLKRLHHRMPVILSPGQETIWLRASASAGQLQQLLKPLPAGCLTCHRVSEQVNKVDNDTPVCVEPLTGDESSPSSDPPQRQQPTLFD